MGSFAPDESEASLSTSEAWNNIEVKWTMQPCRTTLTKPMNLYKEYSDRLALLYSK